MARALNRVSTASITSESLWSEVADRLRRVTVRIVGRESNGAGIVWNTEGLIVTNAHVVNEVALIRLHDRRVFDAELILRDRTRDLAALRIRARALECAELRDSATLRPGELVIAVGHPMGATGAISTGIVHSTSPGAWIQTDARLAPGNSGGPLADSAGRVVGINCMVVDGMGVAISTTTVQQFLRRALRGDAA